MFDKRTKIICTIGPASWDYENLKKLAQAGMDVARLNLSHGTHEEKKQQIDLVRRISQELGKPIAVLADLQGPKIRLGDIDGERAIKEGEIIKLSTEPEDESILPMQFDLSPFVKKDQRIFLNDGLVELKVTKVDDKTITTKALNSGVVSSHKGVNIPDTNLKGASFTSKDFKDALFAIAENVDYIALSFVQNPSDLDPLRHMIKQAKSRTRVIVKVEKKEAVDNLEEIITSTDAVMVARGDLAIEISAEVVPVVQQRIIKLGRQHQKPVIVATQMLESMIENPRPTRAEVSDVANAVLDQVDCVMLSAESASGKHPIEAVKTMSDVIKSVEKYQELKHYIRIDWESVLNEDLIFSAVTSSAASLAYRIDAKAIAVGTVSGRTARILASFRPGSQIVAIVHDLKIYNQLSLVWGVFPIIVKAEKSIDKFIQSVHQGLIETHAFKSGDPIVVVTGTTAGLAGTTNTIKILGI